MNEPQRLAELWLLTALNTNGKNFFRGVMMLGYINSAGKWVYCHPSLVPYHVGNVCKNVRSWNRKTGYSRDHWNGWKEMPAEKRNSVRFSAYVKTSHKTPICRPGLSPVCRHTHIWTPADASSSSDDSALERHIPALKSSCWAVLPVSSAERICPVPISEVQHTRNAVKRSFFCAFANLVTLSFRAEAYALHIYCANRSSGCSVGVVVQIKQLSKPFLLPQKKYPESSCNGVSRVI